MCYITTSVFSLHALDTTDLGHAGRARNDYGMHCDELQSEKAGQAAKWDDATDRKAQRECEDLSTRAAPG